MRDADTDTADILEDEMKTARFGLIHCFTAGPELAKRALDTAFISRFLASPLSKMPKRSAKPF